MSEPGLSPPLLSTPQRFLRSTVASYWSLGGRLLITLASRMALVRLLEPDDYGAYELALRIVIVASVLRDLGLPYHLIRDPRKPYGTVLAFSLASGVVLTLLLTVGAPLFTPFWPELPPVLSVFALWVLLDALVAAPRTYFERELTIGRLVLPEVGRGLVMAGVAVGLAAAGWGVWSLVIGDLAAAALFAALVWWRAWGRMPLAVDWGLVPDLLRKSILLCVVWVVFYLVTYVDSFIVRAFYDAETVGYYFYAYFLAFLTRQIVFPRALLPALVEYRADAARFADAFRVGTIFLLFFEVTAGFFLFFNASKVVELFLGPNWGPVVPLLSILCFVPFLDVFSELGGEVLKVRHEDRLWLAILLLNLGSLVGFGVIFTQRWGAAGMAAANFLLLGNAIMAWRMARIFGRQFFRLLQDMAWIYLVPLVLFGGVALLLPSASWGRLLASVAAGLATAAVLGLRFRPLFQRFLAERSADATPGPPS